MRPDHGPAPARAITSRACATASRAAGQAGNRPWLILAVAALVLARSPGRWCWSRIRSAATGLVPEPWQRRRPPRQHHGPPLTAAPAPAASEQQAAESLASLLAQSVADRTAVHHAYDDVRGCGPDLSADGQIFENAAASRQQLVSQLAALPSGSALSPQMLQELSGAWQASAAVDSDYAQWALDERAGTCVPDDPADPNFQAASGPNEQATQDKLAFTRLSNQLAGNNGLTQYGQDQL